MPRFAEAAVRSTLLIATLVSLASALQHYEKFLMIMFENHGYNQVDANPYWAEAQKNSFRLTDLHAVTHPSQPNYIAQLAGSYFTCTSDSPCNLNKPNLVDLMERAEPRVSWKAYMENYVPGTDGDCNPITNQGLYWRKHNPFMSFTSISSNKTRCQNIVNEVTFQNDVKTNNLPQFGYYTPNIDDDSHDEDLTYSGKYLVNWLNTWYYAYPESWSNSLLFVTWDEDEDTEDNHIVGFFLGPAHYITPNATGSGAYTQYSVTKFVEENWSLGSLGQKDVSAANWANELH